jgi:hypothetical protein
MSNVIQRKMREKFIAYLQVQEMGNYNMFDPMAVILAQEFCGQTIEIQDWVYMMRNYTELYDKYIKD